MARLIRKYRHRLRAMLAGAGSVLDIWAAYPMAELPMRRRESTATAAIRSDVERVGRDLARVIERERGQSQASA